VAADLQSMQLTNKNAHIMCTECYTCEINHSRSAFEQPEVFLRCANAAHKAVNGSNLNFFTGSSNVSCFCLLACYLMCLTGALVRCANCCI
jgi:hypothetical protein